MINAPDLTIIHDAYIDQDECWQCGGQGVLDECECETVVDLCCCDPPTPRRCPQCKGTGSLTVEDNDRTDYRDGWEGE
tara:strand:- start:552 stop:785 length:234 start_codon:yes stop_codon:yes gene_type:complete